MVKKAYRVRNWRNYNRSLIQRGSLTFWFDETVLRGWKNVPSVKAAGKTTLLYRYGHRECINDKTVIQIALSLNRRIGTLAHEFTEK